MRASAYSGSRTTPGQAGAEVSASMSSISSSSSTVTVSEMPAMFRDVTRVPRIPRRTFSPRCVSCLRASPKTRSCSSWLVPPSPLTKSMTSSPSTPASRSDCRTPSSSSATKDCAVGCACAISRRSTPGSPWMPTPTSICPSSRSKVSRSLVGECPGCSATAMLRDWSAARWAIPATVRRSSPRAAAAPATFSTIAVAPVPRRPGESSLSISVATSSATRTCSTSAWAWLAATVKFMTSPV